MAEGRDQAGEGGLMCMGRALTCACILRHAPAPGPALGLVALAARSLGAWMHRQFTANAQSGKEEEGREAWKSATLPRSTAPALLRSNAQVFLKR